MGGGVKRPIALILKEERSVHSGMVSPPSPVAACAGLGPSFVGSFVRLGELSGGCLCPPPSLPPSGSPPPPGCSQKLSVKSMSCLMNWGCPLREPASDSPIGVIPSSRRGLLTAFCVCGNPPAAPARITHSGLEHKAWPGGPPAPPPRRPSCTGAGGGGGGCGGEGRGRELIGHP